MIDRKQRGSHDLEVTIYDLKKDIDLLKEDIQAKDIYIKKLEQELDKIAKPIND